MKEKELRAVSTCKLCGNKIGKDQLPMFNRVRIQRYILDMAAVQRQQGLGMMIGGGLAQVMGPDEELAKMASETEFTVCNSCAGKKLHSIYELESEEVSEPPEDEG